jgi:hypothetical protein
LLLFNVVVVHSTTLYGFVTFNFVVVQVIHFLFLGPSRVGVPHLKHKDSLL